jgi:hypothetical protein
LNHHLKVEVLIEESETAMITNRLINQSWFNFIGALLGSVFGLMGVFAVMMKVTEAVNKKIEDKKNIRDRVVKMKTRIDYFGSQLDAESFKVFFGKRCGVETMPDFQSNQTHISLII